MVRRAWTAAVLVSAAAVLVYFPVLSSLGRQWASDENYSHGFLVAPFAAFLLWKSRRSLAAAPRRPHVLGLFVVICSLLLYLMGEFGAELFLTRLSLLGVAVGAILFLYGSAHLRLVAFPLLLLLLVIPLPALILNRIAFPLQLLASRTAETTLTVVGVPVLREGNVLTLPHLSLEVAQACSGIRSLAALIALALIVGKLRGASYRARGALALLAIPIAVIANAARVAGTGVAAAWIGPRAAEGFLHLFSGWLMFVVALAALLGCARALDWGSRPGRRVELTPAAEAS